MKINFNKKIYNLKSITEAIANFKELAKFKVELKDSYIEVVISEIENGFEKKIKNEFQNYVLYIMNK